MKNLTGLKKLCVDLEHHKSFGCGQANHLGLRMMFFTDDEKIYSQIIVPEHLCSWKNLIHGGIVGTILDEIMFWAAMYFTKKLPLTQKSTNEIKRPPLTKYMPVTAVGYIKQRQGTTSVTMAGELYNSHEELYATAIGEFATIDTAIAERLDILAISDVTMVQGFIDSFNNLE